MRVGFRMMVSSGHRPGVGTSDPRLSFLESVFFPPDTGRLSFPAAVANVHSHVLGRWALSSRLAPALLLVTCENGLSERWDSICHCHFDLHPPEIIRDVQNQPVVGWEFISPLYTFL